MTEGNKMQDKIEKIRKNLIQHGKFNNRIYILKLDARDLQLIINELNQLALKKKYTKIFGKIQTSALPYFILNGYFIEAYIPCFYNGQTDCIIVSKFFENNRRQVNEEELQSFIKLLNSAKVDHNITINNFVGFEIAKLGTDYTKEITEVFKRIFETYPFPVHDPDYILDTIKKNKAKYFGIFDEEKLIGVSTAEIDMKEKNAEMTDFAVLPEYRGRKLALHLLLFMEDEMRHAGIKTAYTIARLKEPGMNKTFINAGYRYTGTLVNNTNIGGSIESMNIYYKRL